MNVVLDTTVIAKGVFPPRRRKKDDVHQERLELHLRAKEILRGVEQGRYTLYVPFVALVEMAAVGARLTGKKERGLEAAEYVRGYANIVPEFRLVDEAVGVAAETKASGFDSLFIACARVTGSTLMTDDRGMHEAAPGVGVDSKLLREMEPAGA